MENSIHEITLPDWDNTTLQVVLTRMAPTLCCRNSVPC